MTTNLIYQEKDITELLPSNLVSEMEINFSEDKKEMESNSKEDEKFIDVK